MLLFSSIKSLALFCISLQVVADIAIRRSFVSGGEVFGCSDVSEETCEEITIDLAGKLNPADGRANELICASFYRPTRECVGFNGDKCEQLRSLYSENKHINLRREKIRCLRREFVAPAGGKCDDPDCLVETMDWPDWARLGKDYRHLVFTIFKRRASHFRTYRLWTVISALLALAIALAGFVACRLLANNATAQVSKETPDAYELQTLAVTGRTGISKSPCGS